MGKDPFFLTCRINMYVRQNLLPKQGTQSYGVESYEDYIGSCASLRSGRKGRRGSGEASVHVPSVSLLTCAGALPATVMGRCQD